MHSMTGFGRGTHTTETWHANVEAAAINRKQLEIVTNLPRSLQSLENNVRQTTLPCVSRGRVQITVKLEKAEDSAPTLIHINHDLAQSFEAAFTELSQTIGRPLHPTPADFIRQPGILELCDSEDIDPEAAWEVIAPALEHAITNLNTMRASEGQHLKEDLLSRLGNLTSFTQIIMDHAPSRPKRQRELLGKRLADLEIPIDMNDDRLVRELALFADRCDISEEATRLHSHFAKFLEYVHAPDASGWSLYFLCLVLFRVFNTIGSKANDSLIAQTVVEAKTELEKIREQVQNVE